MGIAAAILTGIPAWATGQVSVFTAAAAAVPMGAFGDVANPGYQAVLGGTVGVGAGEAVAGLAGFYTSNAHATPGEGSRIYGLAALAGYTLSEAYGVGLTAWAVVGGAAHARTSDTHPGLDASRRGWMLGGGASLARSVGPVSLFLFGFYSSGLGGLNTRAYPTRLASFGAGAALPISPGRAPG